jgi:hypothetical protein
MAIRANLNDVCHVRLTIKGERILDMYVRSLSGPLKNGKTYPPDPLGFRKFQLWELMNIFGGESTLYNGADPSFEGNQILIEVAIDVR